MNYDEFYREWQDFPDCTKSASDVPPNSETVFLYREKNSHRGISEAKSIKKLLAKQVDQEFLNEISKLINLEYLELEVITAENLEPLSNLKNLKTLKLDSVQKAEDFAFLENLPNLKRLFIQNAKHIKKLDFLSNLHNLIALGVEGGMYTKQKVDSVEPLKGLANLEALFMSSVQIKDKNLDYLSAIPNLGYFSCARFAPKSSFESLREKMPVLKCNWCDKYAI
jgi:hypothetical protein